MMDSNNTDDSNDSFFPSSATTRFISVTFSDNATMGWIVIDGGIPMWTTFLYDQISTKQISLHCTVFSVY